MNSQQAIQFLTKQLDDAKRLLQEHVNEFGDDTNVLFNQVTRHPEKWSRYRFKNDILKLQSAIKDLGKDCTFFQATLSLKMIVGGEELDFIGVSPEEVCFAHEEVESKKDVPLSNVETYPKFNNNTRVRLTGTPNGIFESRGKIGDIGIITDVTDYIPEDRYDGVLKGYFYMVKSSSFVGALCNELWVHESSLELIDVNS